MDARMDYLTTEEMRSLFPEQELLGLTNLDDATAATVDLDRLSTAITNASGRADRYLGVRYTLPIFENVADVPEDFKQIIADIARYLLDVYHTRDDVTQRYKDALVHLKDIQAGRATLGLATADEPKVETGLLTFSSTPAVFTDVTLGGLF